MTYDFFATRADKLAILEFIFNETDLLIYDLGSAYDEEICEYKTIEDFTSQYDLEKEEPGTTFQLWSPRHKGKPVFRKVILDPKYTKGHTFRYATDGLGLIQLYFGGISNNGLHKSHIGHFTEKTAFKAQLTYPSIQNAADWDWKEIQITSGKLKYHLEKKLAVRKIGSYGILVGANKLIQEGTNITH